MYQSCVPILKKYFWVVCLSVVLLSPKGAPLHTHVYNHNHDSAMSGHAHHNQTHYAYDTHEAHHGNLMLVDLTSLGVLRNLLAVSSVITFLAMTVMLLLPRFRTRIVRLLDDRTLHIPRCESVPPPLRAPPL